MIVDSENDDDDDSQASRQNKKTKSEAKQRTARDFDSDNSGDNSDKNDLENAEKEAAEEEEGISEAAAALKAVIHCAARIAQTETNTTTLNSCENDQPVSAEVAFEARKADLVRQRACVAYLRDMQQFAGYMMTGVEDVKTMLHAKTVTDVLEAIEFFLIAKQAGVKNLDGALRHMLAMIWSQEETIRKTVRDACR